MMRYNINMYNDKAMKMKLIEAVFCILYLLFAFTAAVIFLFRKDMLCSIMTFFLAGGDAFHLVPRIRIALRGPGPHDKKDLGLGNLVSSITMTLFYVFLYLVMKEKYPAVLVPSFIFPLILIMAIVRICLCLFPQNDWFRKQDKENSWHIYRNIPFIIIGIFTIYYLAFCYRQYLMAVLVLLSFIFYMGTVLFARKNPKTGMLMMPKTICYIWLIALFL